MPYLVLFDANVLHGALVTDLLLRLAEEDFFRPHWSDEILREVVASVSSRGIPLEAIQARCADMNEAFPGAMVDGWQRFEAVAPAGRDPKDVHVAAAAIASGVAVIVSDNARDFAVAELESQFGIEVQRLDDFLLDQWDLDHEVVVEVLRRQALDHHHPPMTGEDLLEGLSRTVPGFARTVVESEEWGAAGQTGK